MKKALFFRNCNNINTYKENSKKLQMYGNYLQYKISKTINLDNSIFNEFISNFKKEYEFIEKNKSKMHMDESDIVYCLLILNNNKKVLIYSAGYNYARYVAIPEE